MPVEPLRTDYRLDTVIHDGVIEALPDGWSPRIASRAAPAGVLQLRAFGIQLERDGKGMALVWPLSGNPGAAGTAFYGMTGAIPVGARIDLRGEPLDPDYEIAAAVAAPDPAPAFIPSPVVQTARHAAGGATFQLPRDGLIRIAAAGVVTGYAVAWVTLSALPPRRNAGTVWTVSAPVPASDLKLSGARRLWAQVQDRTTIALEQPEGLDAGAAVFEETVRIVTRLSPPLNGVVVIDGNRYGVGEVRPLGRTGFTESVVTRRYAGVAV